jgi:putative ribosome biogenesis GTPase RsgA
VWSAVELRKLEPGFSTVGRAANRQREEQETLCKRGSNATKAETDASAGDRVLLRKSRSTKIHEASRRTTVIVRCGKSFNLLLP